MLLSTKFLKPASDARAVNRTRLHRLLEPGQAKRLNLVVAPAGYGKTTLVSQWCASMTCHAAWLALDENDNTPRRFWQYVAGSLKHDGLKGLEDVERQLGALDVHELEGAITGLLNALAENTEPRLLVLDDYHRITDARIHRQFTYFIDYLPPGVTVTLTSRIEPELPLARWRVRQWVGDVHPQMLAFSEVECRHFFRDFMDLHLSDDDVKQVWQQTEGWVAAMQLTALSGIGQGHQGNELPSIHINERQINDYVLSEVLDKQPPEVVQFLTDTACCPRLSASLCDFVRDAGDSQQYLERLMRENLFLIPLDTHNQWFRYHDLFRDALLQRGLLLDTIRVDQCQRRTIDWLLTNGHVNEAIAQILTLEDWPWLASILEQQGNNLIQDGFHLPVLEWLQRLPVELVVDSPQLMMVRIWALFFANRLDRIEPQLAELEDVLDRRVADSHPDAEGALGLHSEISLIRSYLARSRSDEKGASDLTRQVLKDIDHTRIPLKSVTYYGLGLDYFGQGDLAAAEDALRSSVHYGQAERKPSTVLSSGGLLAWIQYNRGEIDLALDTCTEVRSWVDEHFYDPQQPRMISCWQNSALIEIYRERNEKQLADAYLVPLLDHLESGTEPGQHVIIQYVRGHLAFSEGRFQDAVDALGDADAIARRRRDHIVFEPPACGALLVRCHLALNDLASAQAWLADWNEEEYSNPLNREQNEISAARVLIADGKPADAVNRMAKLLDDVEASQHNRQLIEAQLVYASALAELGNGIQAAELLEQAVTRGSEAGFLRIFAEESPAIRKLLLATRAIQNPGSWNSKLRELLESLTDAQAEPESTPQPASLQNELVEPLSQREFEVLSLIHDGLPNKEIAERMKVAATTVKAHIRNLYGKLGVGSRTEALAKARELGIL